MHLLEYGGLAVARAGARLAAGRTWATTALFTVALGTMPWRVRRVKYPITCRAASPRCSTGSPTARASSSRRSRSSRARAGEKVTSMAPKHRNSARHARPASGGHRALALGRGRRARRAGPLRLRRTAHPDLRGLRALRPHGSASRATSVQKEMYKFRDLGERDRAAPRVHGRRAARLLEHGSGGARASTGCGARARSSATAARRRAATASSTSSTG